MFVLYNFRLGQNYAYICIQEKSCCHFTQKNCCCNNEKQTLKTFVCWGETAGSLISNIERINCKLDIMFLPKIKDNMETGSGTIVRMISRGLLCKLICNKYFNKGFPIKTCFQLRSTPTYIIPTIIIFLVNLKRGVSFRLQEAFI